MRGWVWDSETRPRPAPLSSLLFVFKEKKVRHKLIIFLIYPFPFLSFVLFYNENIIFFI